MGGFPWRSPKGVRPPTHLHLLPDESRVPETREGQGTQPKFGMYSPGHFPADLGFDGSRLLKRVGPRFFDLGSHRREKFTALFYIVMT